MVRRRQDHNNFALAFVRKSAARVEQQKQLIARLKKERQPTNQAEADLKQFETTLLTLQNHLEVMEELMKPTN